MKRLLLTSAVSVLVLAAGAQGAIFGGFAPQQSYPCGGMPKQVKAADFNNDGVLDLVTANSNQSGTGNSVSILLGNGDMTFALPVDYPTGALPQSVFALDLNGDNNIDLTVANGNDPSISVLFGNGDGTFFTHQYYYIDPNEPPYPGVIMVHTMADFDGDGDSDIAVAMLTENWILVLPNDGTGTFGAFQEVGQSPDDFAFFTDLEPGDFDGDGDVDLIAISAQQYVQVFLNNGDGTFATPLQFTALAAGFASPFADLNGDGIVDLVMSKYLAPPGGYMLVAMGNGDGTFGTQQTYDVVAPKKAATSDLDGDGDIDVLVPDLVPDPGGAVSVLLNNGDGTFAAAQSFAVGGGRPTGSIAVDLNDDSWPDVVTANIQGNNVSVLINQTCPGDLDGDHAVGVSDLAILLSNYGMTGMTYADGDLDGDGDVDIGDLAALLAIYGSPC
jgi:hypothetical protein